MTDQKILDAEGAFRLSVKLERRIVEAADWFCDNPNLQDIYDELKNTVIAAILEEREMKPKTVYDLAVLISIAACEADRMKVDLHQGDLIVDQLHSIALRIAESVGRGDELYGNGDGE